ncbi:MAG: response regulator, partial [Acidobacteria bacterium]|nr:response regulator [Acidobacteriota bacterium]
MEFGQVFRNQTKTLRYFILILILSIEPGQIFAEGGFKFSRNFSKTEYDHHPQNWCITQDANGIIFVGNTGGVLEYDGVSWRLIQVPNLLARTLAADPSGCIYAGGSSQLGFLSPDSTGKLQYQSLLNRLDTKFQGFGNILQTFSTPGGIYFRASQHFFHWDCKSNQLNTWVSPTAFSAAYFYNGKIYIQQKQIGLQVLENGTFHDIPGGRFFADDTKKINMMVPFDSHSGTFLIGTKSAGFYLYDGLRVIPFPTGADDLLKHQRNLLHGIRLISGDFALATDGAGAIIITPSGKIIHRFDISYGLQDNNVKYIYQEKGGNLWFALNNGISKIEYESPFTIYDQRAQLHGSVLSLAKHASSGIYYIGTTEGLFTLSPDSGSCQPVKDIYSSCCSLISHGDSIIAATDKGVFVIQNNKPRSIYNKKTTCLFQSLRDTNHVWAGVETGIISLAENSVPGNWNQSFIALSKTVFVQSICEEPNGTPWIGTLSHGVYSVSFPNNSNPLITHYGGADGLPLEEDQTIREIYVAYVAKQILFASQHGLYRFDKANGRFVPASLLGKAFTGDLKEGKPVFRMVEDHEGNIWFHSFSINYKAILQPDGTYSIENTSLLRIPILQANSIYTEPGAVWFCLYDALIRYDTGFQFKGQPRPFINFIRRVEHIGDKATLFGGQSRPPSGLSGAAVPVYPYQERNLRFYFAAPYYQEESATVYSCCLKGQDQDWSPWSSEARKDYTNLREGSYSFVVKAKNVYEQVSPEAGFSFKIESPWYRSPLAYIAYFVVSIFILFSAGKFRRYRRQAYEKKHLEVIVQQRTHEIKEKNFQLEEQTRLLTVQSEQLKEMDNVKSRFFANISHEFRTPLTLIMGPLEQILSGSPDLELKNKAQLMLRNSQRLLGLINQLLDLSRLRSGKMRLQVTRKNIIPFLRGIMSSFQLLSEQRQIQLLFLPQEDDITLYFNSENVEQILCNLLSNAVKNTLAGGSITVSAGITQIPGKIELFPDGFLEICVSDTGVGIPAGQLPHIFDLFYQVQAPYQQNSKGSGIGLSLTRELVELHYGDIQARSVEGKGTEFFVYLPLGKAHLKPEEIIDVTRQPISYQNDDSDKTSVQDIELQFPGAGGGEPIIANAPVSPQPSFTNGSGDPELPLILVVDDNADLRRYLCSAFESAYHVLDAVDGKDGWEKASETIPDLVISDVMMPQIDGFELTRRIKQDPCTCHIPVILLTAGTSHESMLEGFETGADDYISKPFHMELLAARVKNLIELRRQFQERMKNQLALQPQAIPISPIDEEFYNELRQTIEKNLSNPGFSVEGLSNMLYMGRTTLYRKILALTGETPNQFIRSYRLRRAAQLLKARVGTVSEVAAMVGFPSPSYFAHCFKAEYYVSPSDSNEENEENEETNKSFGGVQGRVFQNEPLVAEGGARDRELILIVEDSPDMCDFISVALGPHYRVETAADGTQGLARAQDLIPDLIVSDVMMPGCDGFELHRRLKSDIATSHIPIVLLTARACEKDILTGFEIGVDDYITKPFNTDILLARIRVILRLRSHLQAKRKRQLRLEPDEIVVCSMDE